MMAADGTNLRQLTFDPESDARPSWSPDGGHIVFNSPREGNWDIFVVAADGTNLDL